MLDFIKFINDNTDLSSTQKKALMDDFCENLNYQEKLLNPETGKEFDNPESKKDFANRMIKRFIVSNVHELRRRKAEQAANWQKLDL